MIGFKCPKCGSEEIGHSSDAEEKHQWKQCAKCNADFSDDYIKGFWDGVRRHNLISEKGN